MTIKPLPGQLNLFSAKPVTADQAQAAAAQGQEEAGCADAAGVCGWGDCRRPALHVHPRGGQLLCRVHVMWAIG